MIQKVKFSYFREDGKPGLDPYLEIGQIFELMGRFRNQVPDNQTVRATQRDWPLTAIGQGVDQFLLSNGYVLQDREIGCHPELVRLDRTYESPTVRVTYNRFLLFPDSEEDYGRGDFKPEDVRWVEGRPFMSADILYRKALDDNVGADWFYINLDGYDLRLERDTSSERPEISVEGTIPNRWVAECGRVLMLSPADFEGVVPPDAEQLYEIREKRFAFTRTEQGSYNAMSVLKDILSLINLDKRSPKRET